MCILRWWVLLPFFLSPLAHAAEGVPHLDGGSLSLLWGVPFAAMLLSIAVFPLLAREFWHRHFGKVSMFCGSLFFLPFLLVFGFSLTLYELLHALLLEYLPFIILLLALFTVTGGIHINGRMSGTPMGNSMLLLFGTIIASWTGTTGAAILLIRPIMKANAWRQNKKHTVIFFIFLVANIGGSLTPLGDPPLFLGFLQGVDFFWTTTHMFAPMLVVAVPLLLIFYLLDSYYYRFEDKSDRPDFSGGDIPHLEVRGLFNITLLVGVALSVLMSGYWQSGIELSLYHVPIRLEALLRDLLLVLIVLVSWFGTSSVIREANGFDWFPIVEVAKLFAGIFATIIPVIAILKAGSAGSMSLVVDAVSVEGRPLDFMYFWATGILSSFLDNAPTYLVFFNTAGGSADLLMGELSRTLLAISMGAVFMGANTYIGNAPNFMVRSIAETGGVRMPSFFGYMLWSGVFLFPLFGLVTLLFL